MVFVLPLIFAVIGAEGVCYYGGSVGGSIVAAVSAGFVGIGCARVVTRRQGKSKEVECE
jgi:hypothetical protein